MKRDWLIVLAVAIMWTAIIIEEVNKERIKPWRGIVEHGEPYGIDRVHRWPVVYYGWDDTATWQNQMFYSLDTAGIWDKIDVFYVFADKGPAVVMGSALTDSEAIAMSNAMETYMDLYNQPKQ